MSGSVGDWPRLTVVSGPAGAGKSHHVRSHTDPARTVWLTLRDQRDGSELAARLVRQLRTKVTSLPASLAAAVGPARGPASGADAVARAEQLGALVSDALGQTLHRPLTLVLDEIERVADDSGVLRFIESVVRNAPPVLSVILITRGDLPFSVARLRDDDRLGEVGADVLRLDDDHARRLVGDRWPGLDDLAAGTVRRADGNPRALLALGALLAHTDADDRDQLITAIDRSDDPVETIFGFAVERLDATQHRVLDDLAVIDQATAAELARFGHDQPDKILGGLLDAQLVEEHASSPGHFRLTRPAASIIGPGASHRALRVEDAVRLAVGRGDPAGGLAAALTHGDDELLHRTLTTYGPACIDGGYGRLVLDAVARLPEHPELHGLAGRSAQSLGDWQRAIEEYHAAADHRVRLSDAWRHGLLEYLQGNATTARGIYDRALGDATADAEATAADRAMLSGYAGAAAWLTGDLDVAREHAGRSLELAAEAHDDAAFAVAHTLAAMVAASDGDRVSNDWHYVRALQHAEQAGDALQVAHIRSNRGSRLMEEGDYEAALTELDDAVRYADLGGYGAVLALALTNRGEVATKLGRLDDARTDLTTAVDILQRQGSRVVAYPLVGLARVFLARGDIEQARGSCERALEMSEPSADQQLGVAARVQLARALADRDPDAAWEHAQAAAGAGSLDAAEAWSVVGLLAIRRGDVEAGARAAATAADLARRRRDRFALANALEVAALAADDELRQQHLEEAHTLFDELGCPLDAGRIEIRLAVDRLDAFAVTRIAAVTELAQRLGARPLLAQAHEALQQHDSATATLAVTTLGAFGVVRRGETVPLTAWQSKKARDLFKMLVVLRGRSMPRDQAMERLWPGEDPAKVGSKLSVALATIRAVLDPDKQFASDHHLHSDGDALRIDPTTMASDVDKFLSMADSALREYRRTPSSRSAAMLTSAEAAYTGDVFEDDPYVDWYVPLREEARAVYLTVTRELAAHRAAEGDTDDAIRLLLRVLEREPYDEPAHLDLVAALSAVGRHGDARRRYQHYVDRMRELDIEPSSFPTVVRPDT